VSDDQGDRTAAVVVDCHTHVWGAGFLSRAFYLESARRWAAKSPQREPEMIMPRLQQGVVDETGDAFVENMNRCGVDISLVQMVDSGPPLFDEEPEVSMARQVQWYGELQRRHPGRLYCCAFVDQRRPDCVALLRRAVREVGLIGIGEVSPTDFNAMDPALRPVMHLAAELGVPVQIHTRAGVFTEFEGRDHSLDNPRHPEHVAQLARAIPELRIVLCHSGYPHWWQAAAGGIADLPNCVLDISNWEALLDAPQELVPRLAYWRDTVGAERMLFGSDQVSGPRFCGERSHLDRWVAFVRSLPDIAPRYGYRFERDEVDAILGGNARRLYGLS
jgi:predicted TIM-barrel fold metal-dependent hydrolase